MGINHVAFVYFFDDLINALLRVLLSNAKVFYFFS